MRLALAVLFTIIAFGASAQQPNPLPPFAYAVTLGTTQSAVVGQNLARKRLVFINPSTSATVAVCPPTVRSGSPPTPIACAVNGAGSITLPPYGTFTVDAGAPGSQGFGIGTNWNGIASAPSSPLTVLEFE